MLDRMTVGRVQLPDGAICVPGDHASPQMGQPMSIVDGSLNPVPLNDLDQVYLMEMFTGTSKYQVGSGSMYTWGGGGCCDVHAVQKFGLGMWHEIVQLLFTVCPTPTVSWYNFCQLCNPSTGCCPKTRTIVHSAQVYLSICIIRHSVHSGVCWLHKRTRIAPARPTQGAPVLGMYTYKLDIYLCFSLLLHPPGSVSQVQCQSSYSLQGKAFILSINGPRAV